MRIQPGIIFRDFIIFIGLLFLLSILVKRVNRYVLLHKESIIHELDTSFFDTIKTMQRHAGIAYKALHLHTLGFEDMASKRTIKAIQQQLEDIEQKYIHNPAGLALLGPFGTASIVLKEKQLNEQMLTIAATINNLFSTFLHKPQLTEERKKDMAIEQYIQLNSDYAKEIQRLL
ncbi:MAG TPA: hypothetical protein VGW78_03290 [Candidatus Babeliales bacterium]|jgi:hypothetical protein|nr:hypothetical protein [Candidatus Babeliales bacterium]